MLMVCLIQSCSVNSLLISFSRPAFPEVSRSFLKKRFFVLVRLLLELEDLNLDLSGAMELADLRGNKTMKKIKVKHF
jgi:hypothetical protein